MVPQDQHLHDRLCRAYRQSRWFRDAPVSAIVPTPYGSRCTVVVPIQGLNGQSHDVLTGWLVVRDGPPRLVIAYVDL
jgi:hypothetical protein